MKETLPTGSNNVQQVKEQHLKKIRKFGSMTLHPGHILFEFDLELRSIHPAEFEEININFETAKKGDTSARKKVITKDGCLYAGALNERSAKKKFMKMIAEQLSKK